VNRAAIECVLSVGLEASSSASQVAVTIAEQAPRTRPGASPMRCQGLRDIYSARAICVPRLGYLEFQDVLVGRPQVGLAAGWPSYWWRSLAPTSQAVGRTPDPFRCSCDSTVRDDCTPGVSITEEGDEIADTHKCAHPA
jgi:hypothetical protein